MTDANTDTGIDEESTLDMDELAEQVIDELDPGQSVGDKIVLSRRQLVAIAGGGLSIGALASLGVSDAEAQSAVGTIGTSSKPVDVEAVTVNATALTTDDSVTVTTGEATNTLHYGSNQARANAGDQSVALGIGARAPGSNGSGGSIGRHVAVGFQAAQNNTGDIVTASGVKAAQSNTGDLVTAAGFRAAQNNTGSSVSASGLDAAASNTGNNVTASGFRAAQNNTANNVTASGSNAAANNTGSAVTALGRQAAENNTGNRVTASGVNAAASNTGNNVTASGFRAAAGDGLADPTTMGSANIGIGVSAIRNNQASGLIAIGQDAGINAQTDDQLIITDRFGNRRMVMDLTNGDLSIDGSLTQNATL